MTTIAPTYQTHETDAATILAHGHGLADIAGYMVVETDWTDGELRERDVTQFAGADQYGQAQEIASGIRARSTTRQWAKVVTLYADGCRLG